MLLETVQCKCKEVEPIAVFLKTLHTLLTYIQKFQMHNCVQHIEIVYSSTKIVGKQNFLKFVAQIRKPQMISQIF